SIISRRSAMDYGRVESALGLTGGSDAFRESFPVSDALMPGILFFLDPAFLGRACDTLKLDDDARAALLRAAAEAQVRPELARLLWHFHALLFKQPQLPEIPVAQWPALGSGLKPLDAGLNLCVALSGLPLSSKFNRDRSIPAAVEAATWSDVRLWVEYLKKQEGLHGVSRRIVGWLRNHFTGRLYRLGRLQFMPARFPGFCHVYRTVEGRVLAFSGQHPIHPSGKVMQGFHKKEMAGSDEVLMPGHPVLDVHIPEGGALTVDVCRESLERALEFYGFYFRGEHYRGFLCVSWLLDPVLADLLRPESNIIKFQNQFYCFPVPDAHTEAIWRVFGTETLDLATAPRDNSIRRAMLAHLEKGGTFKDGGGFILNEEAHRFGESPYRV
ncbi:MAG: acyltransferase domain-containing protein, partial [Fibrobacterota bacterium]